MYMNVVYLPAFGSLTKICVFWLLQRENITVLQMMEFPTLISCKTMLKHDINEQINATAEGHLLGNIHLDLPR